MLAVPNGHLRVLAGESFFLASLWPEWVQAVDSARGIQRYVIPHHSQFSTDDLRKFANRTPTERAEHCSIESNRKFCEYVLFVENSVANQKEARERRPGA